ncbi:hypothetical protein BSKO_06699 [Bryopsis sp. KO-2023]|nr:hypothetical protein BSKO_06699 [Bryopsis sp. KO-2023]
MKALVQAAEVSDTKKETRFRVPVRVNFGERVLIVGNDPALGGWAIEKAVVMEWTEGDMWEASVKISPGVHEFKCVVLKESGVVWEAGENRSVSIPDPADAVEVKCQMWDTTTTFVEKQSSGYLLEDQYYSSSTTSEASALVLEEEEEKLQAKTKSDMETITEPEPDMETTIESSAFAPETEAPSRAFAPETEAPIPDEVEEIAVPEFEFQEMPVEEMDVASDVPTPGTSMPEMGSSMMESVEERVPFDPLNTGTSFSAQPRVMKGLKLVAGGHIIPHEDKVEKGGEDDYFISTVGLGAIGVADGVSGWANDDVDPALYPRALLKYGQEAYEEKGGDMTPQDILAHGQYRAKLLGSSTACVAVMKEGNKLEIANLGDSGFRLLRKGEVLAASEAQEHEFNFPYQLSHPDYVTGGEFAKDSDIYNLDVRPGDVLVIGSDGLFDNLWDCELCQIVQDSLTGLAPCELAAQAVSTAVAIAATQNIDDKEYYSPWTSNATAEAKLRGMMSQMLSDTGLNNPYMGGKMDDCTVVVAFVM